jgi:exodeoxyribonuclease VII small subunit
MGTEQERELTFEDRLAELETAVRALESGEEPLDQALAIYEQAVGHLKACHGMLSRAEEKVRILSEDGEADFDPEAGK